VLAAVADALVEVSRGTVSAPARIAAQTPTGLLGAMPAYVPGFGLAAKLVSVFGENGTGHSSHRGIVALFDDRTGAPLAIMDASTITAVRTASAATLSMRALARRRERIAVIGTGVQARAQLDLLATLAERADVVVGGRSLDAAKELAALHPQARADSIEAAVRGADVVFCCTGAREAVLERAWLSDGAHVSSVGGSDGPELDAATISDAAVFVEWPGAAASPPPAGAHELQGYDSRRLLLLGAVLDGVTDRPLDGQPLTVFKSTGHAALDVATAAVVYALARDNGSGLSLSL
jgi:ornithine cyclodeaminase/alanine dehydrogenase-like protein (mu-crystallin family)